MNDLVEYKDFGQNYIKYNEHIKTGKHRREYDKLWRDLRVKHNVIAQRYQHHSSSKEYGPEFHRDAKNLMVKWELDQKQRKLDAKARFFGFGKKKKNKNTNTNTISSAASNANNNNNKRCLDLSSALSPQSESIRPFKRRRLNVSLDSNVSSISNTNNSNRKIKRKMKYNQNKQSLHYVMTYYFFL